MAGKPTNFVILIGGPGKFVSCDRIHDQTWKNYLVPVQLATQRDLVGKQPQETIHWLIYAPAYEDRWADDKGYVKQPAPAKKGENLFESRNKAVMDIERQKAGSYLGRIRQVAGTLGVKLTELRAKKDFWDFVRKLPDRSLSRFWYVGHASASGLMLALDHDPATCTAGARVGDMIEVTELQTNEALLKAKFVNTGKASKFYGCFTETFAQQLNRIVGVATEGAIMKIDFGVIDQASPIPNILERLEKSKADTRWTKIP